MLGKSCGAGSKFWVDWRIVAKDMGIDNKDFCPIAFWPLVPLWVLETPKIDLELLEAMLGNMNLDLVHK